MTRLKSSRAEPLAEQKMTPISSKNSIASLSDRVATSHKKWGVDNETPDEYFEAAYWADSRIHTLGNLGILGAVRTNACYSKLSCSVSSDSFIIPLLQLHAALAPISTRMIDDIAYEGVDIRKRVSLGIHSVLTALSCC